MLPEKIGCEKGHIWRKASFSEGKTGKRTSPRGGVIQRAFLGGAAQGREVVTGGLGCQKVRLSCGENKHLQEGACNRGKWVRLTG